ncbi:MAG: DUF481 domain-containing protein [Myxococcota bacterium]
MRRFQLVAAVMCAAWGFASIASADEIVFTNGDRLSGRVVRLVGGKLKLNSPLLGEIEVAASTIQTFSTTQSIEIHTQDGTVLRDVVVKGEPNEFRTAGTSPVGPQTFALDDVVALNPPPPGAPAWHGSLAAAMEIERGNSFTSEADVNLSAVRETKYNRIRFDASYEGDRTKNDSTGDSTTTDRNIDFLLRYDQFLSDKLFWYGSGEGEKDGVKDLTLRFTGGGGFGYRWFNTEEFKLEGDLGLSWISENYEDSRFDEDFVASVLNWSFERQLPVLVADRLTLFQRGKFWVNVEELEDQLFAEVTTGIRQDLTATTFLEAKIVWEYDSEPSGNKERTDVDYIFGFGIRF